MVIEYVIGLIGLGCFTNVINIIHKNNKKNSVENSVAVTTDCVATEESVVESIISDEDILSKNYSVNAIIIRSK